VKDEECEVSDNDDEVTEVDLGQARNTFDIVMKARRQRLYTTDNRIERGLWPQSAMALHSSWIVQPRTAKPVAHKTSLVVAVLDRC
jgi:hypothetical protein